MPVSEAQAIVMRLLAHNRSPSAYLAGGMLAARTSKRFSSDIDYFHDSADLTLETFEADKACLVEAGYRVDAPDPRPGFVRAIITKGDVALKVDWAHEASWHFFQPLRNDDVGFELHWADAATNKVLAMASRTEIRDGFDALHWHRNPISLGALIWAAAGKDLGMTPGLILDEMRRNARITPSDLAALHTITPIDAQEFGKNFRQAAREAEELIERLPPETAGHLFLDSDGNIIDPDPGDATTLERPLAASKGGLVPDVDDAPEPFA